MAMTRREFARFVGSSALFLRTARLRAAEREWRVTGHDVPELRSFDTTIERYMRTRSIRAGALAATRNGQLVLAKGYSFDDVPDARVDLTALFRIASLSKPITSAVVFRLVQERESGSRGARDGDCADHAVTGTDTGPSVQRGHHPASPPASRWMGSRSHLRSDVL